MVPSILDMAALSMAPWSQLFSDKVASDKYRLGKTDSLGHMGSWTLRKGGAEEGTPILDSSVWLV